MLLHPRAAEERARWSAPARRVTAGSVLAHPVERLDMVEISPAVIEAAPLLQGHNRNAVDDPRTHVHIDDAKTFMALAPHKYDLIISEPSNPWVAGVVRPVHPRLLPHADQHLTEDGILVQWIHTYESSEEILKLVIRTLRETFPHATTWLGPTDLILVASRKPLTLDARRWPSGWPCREVREDLARTDIHDVFGAARQAGAQRAGAAGVRRHRPHQHR